MRRRMFKNISKTENTFKIKTNLDMCGVKATKIKQWPAIRIEL
jgi:hypothetical protein